MTQECDAGSLRTERAGYRETQISESARHDNGSASRATADAGRILTSHPIRVLHRQYSQPAKAKRRRTAALAL
jgi:hypothetical protein